MADISTGKQRGIVPFVDETTGRLPDQYIPQRVIDLQGDLEQAVSGASATAAKASETAAKASETDADSSAQAAAASAESAQTATESAASSKDAAARSASEASVSAQAAEASKTNAAETASNAATQARNAVDGFELTVGSTTTSEPGGDAVVTIEKTGTKYVANFTIPRGEQGPNGSTIVTHDNTLTGDGTISNPLRLTPGTMSSGSTEVADCNNITSQGRYTIQRPIQNSPYGDVNVSMTLEVYVLERDIIQVARVIWDGSKGVNEVWMRAFVVAYGIGWNAWQRVAFMSEIPNTTTLANDIASLSTRVQALEARINSLETNQ